jgi:pyridoxine 5-phosphate synthase
MTKLSVNINKIATLRNSRGHDMPNLVNMALDCERFGAEGITIHPRPDERHITYQDVFDLKKMVTTEYNIEGNPTEGRFEEVVLANLPTQATLVPDTLSAVTSNAGWDTITHKKRLKELVKKYQDAGIRVSIFVDPDIKMVEGAAEIGTDRIELYTESYADVFLRNKAEAIEPFVLAAKRAHELGLGINAGHDLNLDNLRYFHENIPQLLEVSIGHALICDSIYLGLENTIQLYLRELTKI